MKLIDINSKVDRIMKNPHINFFIIMNLILIISCYSLMNDHNKLSIKYFISNPFITLISIIGIIILGYYNINIAILCLVLLFIIIYTLPSSTEKNIEGFTSDDNKIVVNSIEDIKNAKKEYSKKINSKIDKQNNDAKKKLKDENHNNLENKINSITKVFTDQLHVPENAATNEFKQGLLENKQKLLEKEHNHNKNKKNTNKRKKENFQTVELRSFDPSNEVDTNLLITKEILHDMINRIEFNYETVPYLKKYLKHRLEEIIDINKLLIDDDDE